MIPGKHGNRIVLQTLDDLERLPLREIDELLRQGLLPARQAENVFRRINDRYQALDVMTDEELTALRGLRDRLTDVLNPYTVEQLDKEAAELDAKFPGRVHGYHRIGKTVTWYDKRQETQAGDGARAMQ